jgi:hypothetical protein
MAKRVYLDRAGLPELASKYRHEGLSYAVIANILNVPASTARNWVCDIPCDRSGCEAAARQRRTEETVFSQLKTKGSRKRFLIRKRGRICEKCKGTEWLGMPIPIEVHHEDGNSLNNVEENLTLLCPNCHSFTDYYRGKNTRRFSADNV